MRQSSTRWDNFLRSHGPNLSAQGQVLCDTLQLQGEPPPQICYCLRGDQGWVRSCHDGAIWWVAEPRQARRHPELARALQAAQDVKLFLDDSDSVEIVAQIWITIGRFRPEDAKPRNPAKELPPLRRQLQITAQQRTGSGWVGGRLFATRHGYRFRPHQRAPEPRRAAWDHLATEITDVRVVPSPDAPITTRLPELEIVLGDADPQHFFLTHPEPVARALRRLFGLA